MERVKYRPAFSQRMDFNVTTATIGLLSSSRGSHADKALVWGSWSSASRGRAEKALRYGILGAFVFRSLQFLAVQCWR